MTNTIKKIAYLRGLCEGLGIAEESKEGVILKGILDILDDMADDMAMFAEILDEEIDDDEFDDELDDDFDDENEAEEEAEYSYAFICPNCGQELEVDEDVFENETELTCPACGNKIPIIDEFEYFDDEEK